ncbi:MAG: hypothetical protein RLZZ165_2128 [Bacteroidota bacterium]
MQAIKVPHVVERVRAFIAEEGMPPSGSRVLVALSGGGDSVGLLLILKALDYRMVAVHCNYGLREAAIAEEEFVTDLANTLGIALCVRRFTKADFESHRGEGTQQVARRLRYALFEEVMSEMGISHCATGHHSDDQMETMLMSLLRGSGPRLIHSIPSVRGAYFRPLLCLYKQEIQAWLMDHGQSWCHDLTNDQDQYQRNLVRNQLIPLLQRLNPRFAERFLIQSRRAQAQADVLDAFFQPMVGDVVTDWEHGHRISSESFSRNLDSAHFPVFLDWWLMKNGFFGNQIQEIQRLAHASSGARYICPHATVLKDRDWILVDWRKKEEIVESVMIPDGIEGGYAVEFSGRRFHFSIGRRPENFSCPPLGEKHWLDLGRLRFPMYLRKWGMGDHIYPLGMQGTRKISDILIDQKRDRFSKADAWVMEDGDGIVLLGGYRIAQRVAVSADTDQCLVVEVHPAFQFI